VLYTSRLKSLSGIAPKQTSGVEKFTEEEAEELFHNYLDPVFSKDDVNKHRQMLLDFAARVEMLPIAVAVGASLLRGMETSPLREGALSLRMEELIDGIKIVPKLFDDAIRSQPEREQKLLAACSICVHEGFWLPIASTIADLSVESARQSANLLARSSLLRVLDRGRQRFQLHALLREQLRERAGEDGLAKLQERHAAALEQLFKGWEMRWQECRDCLEEVLPAAQFLWKSKQTSRQAWVTYWGYATAQRIGEMDAALRILQQEESFWSGRDDPEAKVALQRGYGNQALILKGWGRLEEALELLKKQEAICLELGNKDGLQASYGNQALILRDWGRLEEALALYKKQEAICPGAGQQERSVDLLRQPGADP
jgi:tetratricopeptide (TPR) repeat protein